MRILLSWIDGCTIDKVKTSITAIQKSTPDPLAIMRIDMHLANTDFCHSYMGQEHALVRPFQCRASLVTSSLL